MVLVLILLLLLLRLTVCQTQSVVNCSIRHDLLPIRHEFYQPGGLVVGMIASQVFFMYDTPTFMEQPSQMLINDPV